MSESLDIPSIHEPGIKALREQQRLSSLRNLGYAALLGAINGLVFAFAADPFRDAYNELDYLRAIVEGSGIHPYMGGNLKPTAEVII
jgi:hypothetical protein